MEMFQSKYVKIVCLIIIVVIVLSGIGFSFLKHKSHKDISSDVVQSEQADNNNLTQNTTIKENKKPEEQLNPAQKYYKDYLERDVDKFLEQAKTSKDNDIEFSKLQTKFIKATDFLNEKYAENIDISDIYYQRNWVKLSCIEGIYFYGVNSEYLIEKYGQYLSSAYNEWLKFIIKRETVMQDGGFMVPPDTVREYIILLEKFVNENPKFVLISDAKDILNSYLMIYLEGVDNSPIFDKWNTRKMKPEFKESYEKFLSENKDSIYYPMVEELYHKAKTNDFTWDRDFEQWLYEYHKKYFAD